MTTMANTRAFLAPSPLRTALESLSPEDAALHMQRCIDSGLWDPKGGGGGSADGASSSADGSAEID